MELAKRAKEVKTRGTIHAFSSYLVSAPGNNTLLDAESEAKWLETFPATGSSEDEHIWNAFSCRAGGLDEVRVVKCRGVADKNFLSVDPCSAHRHHPCQASEGSQSHTACRIWKWTLFPSPAPPQPVLPEGTCCVSGGRTFSFSLLSFPLILFFLWHLDTSAR